MSRKDDICNNADRFPRPQSRNRHSIWHRLFRRAGINPPAGLVSLVSVLVLGALLLFAGQTALGVFDNEKKSGPSAGADQSQNDELTNDHSNGHSSMTDEPMCTPGLCDDMSDYYNDTLYYQDVPPVTVLLGKDIYAKLTNYLRDDADPFCSTFEPTDRVCSSVNDQQILKTVLTPKQLEFLEKHDINTSSIRGWVFIGEGSPGAGLVAFPSKPSSRYDKETGTATLVNP
jgi:hypothetical protein